MGYAYCAWLPDVLRAAGLTVVEHDGWRSRGLAGGVFEPKAVVWHHDASPKGDSPGVPAYMIRNFSNGAAQLWVSRYGEWHVVAAGRAPHAGVVLPGMPGNSTSIGIETDHTTGEEWPPALLDSLRIGTAAILARLGVGAEGLHFHKTVCSPPGRKVDPDGLSLAAERQAVATAGGRAAGGSYTVKRGDTAWGIARSLGMATAGGVAALLALNGIGPSVPLQPGQVIQVPGPTVTVTAPPVVVPPVVVVPAPIVPPPAAKPVAKPTIRLANVKPGKRSEDVKKLQRRLGVNPTGFYGPKTRAAVKRAQVRYWGVGDGVVGKQTLSRLGFIVR